MSLLDAPFIIAVFAFLASLGAAIAYLVYRAILIFIRVFWRR